MTASQGGSKLYVMSASGSNSNITENGMDAEQGRVGGRLIDVRW
jgi:hypothetical protein